MENKKDVHDITEKTAAEFRLMAVGHRDRCRKLELLIQARARRRLQSRSRAVADRTTGLEVAGRFDGVALEGAARLSAHALSRSMPQTAGLSQGADATVLATSMSGLGATGLVVGLGIMGLKEGLKEKNPIDQKVDTVVSAIDEGLDRLERTRGRDAVKRVMLDRNRAAALTVSLEKILAKNGAKEVEIERYAEIALAREAQRNARSKGAFLAPEKAEPKRQSDMRQSDMRQSDMR